MPFLSSRDNRELSQNITQSTYIPESGFGEVFGAAVGQVFDEELSISSALNKEGFAQRNSYVRELGANGDIDLSPYTNSRGRINYNKLAEDGVDPRIKTDKQLYDERSEMLAKRRAYAQDVIARGNGMAQFLGMMTGYVLDPVNIATLPIATAGTAAKGLGAVGKAIQVGKNEAGLAVAAELMIQPLVYEHKHDIESPFEFKDALTNIVTAAAGAAAIGTATGGISGYFKSVREKAADFNLDEDAQMALSSMARIEDDLNLNPEKINLDLKKVETDFIDNLKADLSEVAATKISKAERASLNDALARSVDNAEIASITARLDADDLAIKAESDLAKINKGELTPDQTTALKNAINDAEIDVDRRFMEETNNKMEVNNQPSKVYDNYIKPERKPATTGTITQREREVIERQGLTKDYDADIEAFKSLENPRIVQDGEVVDAGDFMKSLDDEIKGIEEVLVCAI